MKPRTVAPVAVLLALSFLAAAVALASSGADVVVERIRYIGTARYGRVVVDLSAPARFHFQKVPARAEESLPPRLVVDVDGARIGPEAESPLTIDDALLRRIRTGQFTVATARIVLDLASEAEVNTFTLPDPYRLVIDLRGKEGSPGPLAAQIRRLDSTRSPAERSAREDRAERSARVALRRNCRAGTSLRRKPVPRGSTAVLEPSTPREGSRFGWSSTPDTEARIRALAATAVCSRRTSCSPSRSCSRDDSGPNRGSRWR
jgi:hypothetical protein